MFQRMQKIVETEARKIRVIKSKGRRRMKEEEKGIKRERAKKEEKEDG